MDIPLTRILAWDFYVPETVLDNSHFVELALQGLLYNEDIAMDREKDPPTKIHWQVERGEKVEILTDEKIVRITGISQRRKAEKDEYVHHLGINAAQKLLGKTGISPEEIAGILFGTVTSQHEFPSAAVLVQEGIGATNASVCNDIGAACSGFVTALNHADAMIKREILEGRNPGYWLILGGETLTKITDYTYLNSTLFGDGVGGVLLSGPSSMPSDISMYADVVAFVEHRDPFNGQSEMIFRDKYRRLRMPDGHAVYKQAVPAMCSAVREVMKLAGWESVDLVVPHQANARIIEKVAQKLRTEKYYMNIHKYGNMSGATTPIAVTEAIAEGRIQPGSKVVVTTFGAGKVWNAAALEFKSYR